MLSLEGAGPPRLLALNPAGCFTTQATGIIAIKVHIPRILSVQ